ncbi:MAG: TonB family protein [candidate division Zixibacteria bacterium]|nr:TonB family protein [candidate division Zixibacteria bacterium]
MKSQNAVTLPKTSGAFVSYGAIELKRCYQKHLGLAVIIAGALHLAVIGGFLLYSNITAKVPEAAGVVRIKTIAELAAPPSVSQTQTPQVAVAAPGIAPPSIGIPKAVPDEEAPEEVTIATQEELGKIADLSATSIIGGEGGDSIAIEIPLEDYLPPPDEFVPYDELPVALNEVKPEYPPLAKQAGIEGTVWIKALVDKKGMVRDAVVFKPSGSSAGFEDVAIEGAFKIKYKPAISNNQPVAVWVVYPVRFTLK